MNTTCPAIKADRLSAGYDGIPVMENVSFEVQKGEIFVIIGGSGCGKSTLLKHLIGLLPPISGDIFILGENLGTAVGQQREQILRKIGVAFQSGALFGSMNVIDNVKLPLIEFTALPQELIDDIAWHKLNLVGLAHSAYLSPSQLSGGMKKRAALARAMALDPAVIFLDEPSAGLDPVTSAELDQLVKTLAASLGITFVIVTHELASIDAISDRIIMLDKQARGIIATGTVAQLKADTAHPAVTRFFNRVPLQGEEK
jgi:phospholipid/cholesterol/gamma-HCH transport system ATP-binding protein